MTGRRMTEKQLQDAVIKAAQLLGWRVAHFRPALTQTGRWVTAVQGDGVGFPDLVLVRPPRLMFVELKSHRGQVSDEQQAWLSDLTKVANMEEPGEIDVYVWRPADWESGVIERRLR